MKLTRAVARLEKDVIIAFILFHVTHEFRRLASTPAVFHIVEELPSETYVGNMRENSELLAHYANYDVIPQLLFSFRSVVSESNESSPYQYFSLSEQTGLMFTRERLDREEICPDRPATCSLTLDVVVQPMEYFQVLRVVVIVRDINDNTPTFAHAQLRFTVPETTAARSIIAAVPAADDADSAPFGVVDYLMTAAAGSENKFQLVVETNDRDGSKDVQIRLLEELDHETDGNYSMTVIAVDGGSPPKSGSVRVTIVVGDSNDNSPEFDGSSYEVELSENQTPPMVLVRVHARDADRVMNGEVRYSLSDLTDPALKRLFAVNTISGEVELVESLDREQQKIYQLTVVATDLGVGSRPATVKVKVVVLDENDNAPEITVSYLGESEFAELSENSEPGTMAAHVRVRDADEGGNGRVDCRIDSGERRRRANRLFQLEEFYGNEYQLVSAVMFDRENKSVHDITMTCSDRGTPQLSVSKLITVHILDENDNTPTFDQTVYVVDQEEGNPIGTSIVRISAVDLDVGVNAELVYRLESAVAENATGDGEMDYNGILTIDPVTGVVSAAAVFDFEMRQEYRLLVVVSDRGEPIVRSSSASLVVRIIDVNDEWPRFDRDAYQFTIDENLPAETVVGSVRAADQDVSREFHEITYYLETTSGERSDAFGLDPKTGVLTAARRFDREDRCLYELIVVATNGVVFPHITTRANVTVHVADVNDNAPEMRFPTAANQHVFLSSRAVSGSHVTRIEATDADVGENALLEYSISAGDDDDGEAGPLFSVDPLRGVVRLTRNLGPPGPTASAGRSYRHVISVRDGGRPQLESLSDLVISVNRSRVGVDPQLEIVPSQTPQQLESRHLASSTSTGSDNNSSHNNNLVIILGIVITFVVALVITVVSLMIFCTFRRRENNKRKEWQRQLAAETATTIALCSRSSHRDICTGSHDFFDSQRSLSSSEWRYKVNSAGGRVLMSTENVAPTDFSAEKGSVFQIAAMRDRRVAQEQLTDVQEVPTVVSVESGVSSSSSNLADISRRRAVVQRPVRRSRSQTSKCSSRPRSTYRRPRRSVASRRPAGSRPTYRHSDMEVNDNGADSQSEYSGSYIDSGLDAGEDGDHAAHSFGHVETCP